MSFNTNWDVDQYKTEHECDEHWQLRRNFMLAHKDRFPEERLVCLAAVFTNVELLGCRYPAETMELVAHLSEGVADKFREKQKTKLQRTFVKASDAAGAKVKGLKRPASDEAGPSDVPAKCTKSGDSSVPSLMSHAPSSNYSSRNLSFVTHQNILSTPSLVQERIKTLSPATEVRKSVNSEKHPEQRQNQRDDDRKDGLDGSESHQEDSREKRFGDEKKTYLDDHMKIKLDDQRVSGLGYRAPQSDILRENGFDDCKGTGSDSRREIKYDDLKEIWSVDRRENRHSDSSECKFDSGRDLGDSKVDERKDGLEAERKGTLLNGSDVNVNDAKCSKSGNDSDNISERGVPVTKLTKKNRQLLKGSGKDRILATIRAGKFGRIVLLEDDVTTYAGQIIARSAACCQIPFRFEYEDSVSAPSVFCKVFLNNQLLSSACGVNKKEARKIAVELGYHKLRQLCYILKVKKAFLSENDVVLDRALEDKGGEDLGSGPSGLGSRSSVPQRASLDLPMGEGFGSKLMRSMGWTGGGLGKDEQGVQEPVRLSQQVNRAGLGLPKAGSDMNSFRAQVHEMLREYARKDTLYDLVFASDFTPEERALMHQLANAKGLKSKSYGKGDNRHLVISKKKDFVDIVVSMIEKGEYSTERYDLLEPTSLPPCQTLSEDDSAAGGSTSLAETQREIAMSRKAELKAEVENLVHDAQIPLPTIMDSLHGSVEVYRIENENDPSISYHGLNAGPYGRLVLVEEEGCTTPTQIIERSANGCHIPFKYEYDCVRRGMLCSLYVNNTLVVSATEYSKKAAREIAVDAGVHRLKDLCYTLKTHVKIDGVSVKVVRKLIEPRKKGNKDSSTGPGPDIICVSKLVDRTCLGIKSYTGVHPSVIRREIQDLLVDYMRETCPYDLVVPPDFLAADKMSIQKMASRYGLKTSFYKVSKKDFLVISKKQPIQDVAEALLRTGGNTTVDPMQEP